MHYDLSKTLDKESFKARVNKLYEQGKVVELREVKQKRSLSQNAILHLWIAVIAEAIGEIDREAVKRDVKLTLLGTEEVVNRFTGEIIQQEYRTSKMTTEQMSDLLTRMKHWALEDLGVYLPSPEDVGYGEMIEKYQYQT